MKHTITILLLLISHQSIATCDFLSYNDITEEYYWGDEDHSPGAIGWKHAGDFEMEQKLERLQQKGYTLSNFPFKLDLLVLFFVSVLTVCLFRYFRTKPFQRLSSIVKNAGRNR